MGLSVAGLFCSADTEISKNWKRPTSSGLGTQALHIESSASHTTHLQQYPRGALSCNESVLRKTHTPLLVRTCQGLSTCADVHDIFGEVVEPIVVGGFGFVCSGAVVGW